MNNEEAKKKLKAKLECLKRETSGTDIDCNRRNCDECSLCYEQGNMGEQKEALDMAIEALEQKPKHGRWENVRENNIGGCSECGCCGRAWMNFCWNCGAEMENGRE